MTVSLLLCTLFFVQIDDLEAWDQKIQEELTVNFITLDVMAVDKQGRPVTNLKASDFVVKDKGRKVKISFFDTLDMLAGEGEEPMPEDDSGNAHRDTAGKADQQLILALDLEDVNTVQAAKTLKQLRSFITTLDHVFNYRILVYSMEHGAVTQGFVGQRKKVLLALDAFTARHFGDRVDSRRPAAGEGTVLDDLAEDDSGPTTPWKQGSNLKRGPISLADLEEACEECMKLFQGNHPMRSSCINDNMNAFIEKHYDRTLRVLGELQSLTRKFEQQDGMKTMLLVSPGFSTTSLDAAIALPNFMLGGKDELHSQTAKLFNSERMQHDYRTLLHSCTVNRIIFHAFDIYNPMDTHQRAGSARFGKPIPKKVYNDYNQEVSSGLFFLAQDTGGSFTQAFTLSRPIGKVMNASRFYYHLGYNTPKGKKGAWRKLKITCKRKGVRLTYRKGYFG